MGTWTDLATWRGPTPNQGGRMTAHRGVVLHIAEGTYEGTVAWCLNSNSGVSAHFVVAKSGTIAQLVDTEIRSWCQSDGNPEWVSIENEGRGGESLTAPQVVACAKILARAHQVYGIPLAVTDSPSGRGLGHHSMGGVAWGNHPNCPGDEIIAQKPRIIAAAQQIVGGTTAFLMEGSEDNMKCLMRWQDSPHVFLTDGVVARWITSAGEMGDLGTLSDEERISLAGGTTPRVVARRELIGRIVGQVPEGWEDYAASPAGATLTITDQQIVTLAAETAKVMGSRIGELEARVSRIVAAIVAAG